MVDLTPLRARFRGELLTAADGARYDTARAAFNAVFDRRPGVIARATGAADVIAAVTFARESRLPLAVRGGGHSVAGYSTIESGLLLDLGPMKGVRVDPVARRVRAQPGLTWGELDRETQAFGLATTGGRVTSTGIAGFILGSGSGWLERLHGLACDNLVAADVVTADGRLLTASAAEHAELFWGLKGGGGNFGVVTEFELALHRIGPEVLGGMLLFERADAVRVCRAYREWMRDAPPELGGGLVFLVAPPAPFVPQALRLLPAVAVIVAWFGEPSRGQVLLDGLRRAVPPAADLVQRLPYCALQSIVDAGNPPGRRQYWRSDNLRALDDDAVDTIVACANRATSPFSNIILQPGGHALAAVPDEATPLGGRNAPWQAHCYGNWEGGDDARHIAWVKDTERALAPWAAGHVSLNFISDADGGRVRAAFGDAKYRRLAALKRVYDPDNLFRSNQNIVPAPD
ncbi:MAG: FAD-binding oxidoreductase [Ideonella sp.]|nr:FAD-binding oxidoreductase [Ideonella sp.]MCC7458521.1 FAD-binding oxidoreductase [Nitrospira sp.]